MQVNNKNVRNWRWSCLHFTIAKCGFSHLCDGAQVAHEWALLALAAAAAAAALGSSGATGEGASFRGGMRSLMASKPLASSKEVILWFGENPWSAAIQTNIHINFCTFEEKKLLERRLTVFERSFASGEGTQGQSTGRCETLELQHTLALLSVN